VTVVDPIRQQRLWFFIRHRYF